MDEPPTGDHQNLDPSGQRPVAEATLAAPVVPLRRTAPEAADLIARLYDEHQRELFSFALHATRDPATAEDVTQESFTRLVRLIRDGTIPDDPRAWLYRVAGNLVISRGRRESVAERHRSSLFDRDEDDRSPERVVLRRERRDAVQVALDGLAPDARTALLLAANGFSGQEVAAAIGRTETATRTLLCRARASLRERLAGAAID